MAINLLLPLPFVPGWLNSAVNPFLYASYSPTFRKAFFDLTFGSVISLWRKVAKINKDCKGAAA